MSSSIVNEIMAIIDAKDPMQPEFRQAVEEVVESVAPVVERNPELKKAKS